MGGRGSFSSSAPVDLGGVTTTRGALNLRKAVNRELGIGRGAGGGTSLAEYGIRRERFQGKSNEDIMKEDRRRLKEARERKKEKKSSAFKTFVNSYGEATKRNITSSSYENAQRRLNKQMMSFVGGK